MDIKTLHDLFLFDLQMVSNVEEQIKAALPLLADIATTPAVKDALTSHLDQTKKQQQTVQDLLKEFGIENSTLTDSGMEGIIKAGQVAVQKVAEGTLRDLAIISAAQKVEHYEIACYGTLTNYAQEMGNQDAQDLLHKILEEEKMTDEQLTTLAESLIPQVPSGL